MSEEVLVRSWPQRSAAARSRFFVAGFLRGAAFFAGLSASGVAWAAAPCAVTLPIAASPAQSGQLRALLGSGVLSQQSDPVCSAAQVRLSGTEAPWQLSLTVDGDSVKREVATMDDAAAWIESWLMPLIDPIAGGAEIATAAGGQGAAGTPLGQGSPSDSAKPASAAPIPTASAAPSTLNAPPGPAPFFRPYAGLGLLALVGSDASIWGGPVAGVGTSLGEHWWVGASGATAFEPVVQSDSPSAPNTERELLLLGLEGGPRLRAGARAELGASVGMGIVSATATQQVDGGQREGYSKGVYGNAGLRGSLDLGWGFSLQSSVSLLLFVAEEPSAPAATSTPIDPLLPEVDDHDESDGDDEVDSDESSTAAAPAAAIPVAAPSWPKTHPAWAGTLTLALRYTF